jgi:hypothetical protein
MTYRYESDKLDPIDIIFYPSQSYTKVKRLCFMFHILFFYYTESVLHALPNAHKILAKNSGLWSSLIISDTFVCFHVFSCSRVNTPH